MAPEDKYNEVANVILRGSLAPLGPSLAFKPFTPDTSGSKLYSGYGGQEHEGIPASVPEAVRVAVRIRPPIEREFQEGGKTAITCRDSTITMGHDRKFYFDHVFGPETTQSNVYTGCTLPLLKGFVEGYNATVLAYGQTGSGKTFTMGTDAECLAHSEFELIGILPRLVTDLYASIDKEQADHVVFSVRCQFLEIYQEEIRDLLSPSTPSKQIAIREADGRMVVSGALEVEATDYKSMMTYFFSGCRSRTTGATLMNTRSSRSHAVFTIILRKTTQEPTGAESVTMSKLHLVDLAGSERNKKTGAKGLRFKESVNINKGLLALGNVITALGDPSKKGSHVPYRQSRITRLLQDSLGGNSQTLMIACCSPAGSNKEETLNTLKYANRARNIKNKPKKLTGLSMDEISALQQALIAEVHTTLKVGSPASDPQAIIEKLNGESLWRVMVQLAHGLQQAAGAIPPPPRDDILLTARLLTDGPNLDSPPTTPNAADHTTATADEVSVVVTDSNADLALVDPPLLKAMADSLSALRGEHAKLVECIRETSATLETINHSLREHPDGGTDLDMCVANASSSLAAIVSNLDMLVTLVADDSDSEHMSDAGVQEDPDEDLEQDDDWKHMPASPAARPTRAATPTKASVCLSPIAEKTSMPPVPFGSFVSPVAASSAPLDSVECPPTTGPRSAVLCTPVDVATGDAEMFNKWKATGQQPEAIVTGTGKGKGTGAGKKPKKKGMWAGMKSICSSIKQSISTTRPSTPRTPSSALVKVSMRVTEHSPTSAIVTQTRVDKTTASTPVPPLHPIFAPSVPLSAVASPRSHDAPEYVDISVANGHVSTLNESPVIVAYPSETPSPTTSPPNPPPPTSYHTQSPETTTSEALSDDPESFMLPPPPSTRLSSSDILAKVEAISRNSQCGSETAATDATIPDNSQRTTPAFAPEADSFHECRVSATSEDWPTPEELEGMEFDATIDPSRESNAGKGITDSSVQQIMRPIDEEGVERLGDDVMWNGSDKASHMEEPDGGYIVGSVVASLLYGKDASQGSNRKRVLLPKPGTPTAGDWLMVHGGGECYDTPIPEWLQETNSSAMFAQSSSSSSSNAISSKVDSKKASSRRPWS